MNQEEFHRAVRSRTDLQGVDLSEVEPFRIDLSGIDLSGADLSTERPPQVVTGEGTWPRGFADPFRVVFRRVRARRTNFSGADLSRVFGWKGDFREANLAGAKLVESDLRDADFRGADLRGADLSGSVIDGASFLGATWDDTTVWPNAKDPHRAG